MSPDTCIKDPDETKIFTFDWTQDLNAGATVSGSNNWSATPAGLTFASQTIDAGGKHTSAKISGGAPGADYIVTNLVTTSDGETLEESGRLRVKNSSA